MSKPFAFIEPQKQDKTCVPPGDHPALNKKLANIWTSSIRRIITLHTKLIIHYAQILLKPRHSPVYVTVKLWKVWHKWNFVQVRIEYTYSWVHMYVQHSTAETRLTVAWPPCCLCYYPVVFFHHFHLILLSLPVRKIQCAFQKCYFNRKDACLKLHKSKLCNMWSVCTVWTTYWFNSEHKFLLNKLGFLVHRYILKEIFRLKSLLLKHTNTHNFVYSCQKKLLNTAH